MDIQKAFEESVIKEQYKENKLDLTRHIYITDSYQSDLTNLAFNYFLKGFNDGMRP